MGRRARLRVVPKLAASMGAPAAKLVQVGESTRKHTSTSGLPNKAGMYKKTKG